MTEPSVHEIQLQDPKMSALPLNHWLTNLLTSAKSETKDESRFSVTEIPDPIVPIAFKESLKDKNDEGGKNSSGRERIMCPVCRTVVVKRVYRRHFETMHCIMDPATCQFCNKVFKHRYSLDCHQRQSHPNERFGGKNSAPASSGEQLLKKCLEHLTKSKTRKLLKKWNHCSKIRNR